MLHRKLFNSRLTSIPLNILGSFFGLVVTWLFIKHFGVQLYAVYGLSLKYASILMTITLLGNRQRIIRSVSREEGETNLLIINSRKSAFFISLITFIILLIINKLNIFLPSYSKENTYVLTYMIAAVLFNSQTKINIFKNIGLGKINLAVFLEGFLRSLLLLISISLFWNFKCYSLVSFMQIYLLISVGIYLFSSIMEYKTKFLINYTDIERKIKRTNWMLFLNNIFEVLFKNLDVLILSYYINDELMAIYLLFAKFTETIGTLETPLNQIMARSIARNVSVKQLYSYIWSLYKYYIIIGFVVAGTMIPLIFMNILKFYGPVFMPYSKVLTLIMLLSATRIVLLPYERYFVLTNREKLDNIILITAIILFSSLIFVVAELSEGKNLILLLIIMKIPLLRFLRFLKYIQISDASN